VGSRPGSELLLALEGQLGQEHVSHHGTSFPQGRGGLPRGSTLWRTARGHIGADHGFADSVVRSVVATDAVGRIRDAQCADRPTERCPSYDKDASPEETPMTTTETPRIDEVALEQFVHQAVGDLAAAISGLMVHLGDRLGLYRAMAGAGPLTPADLATLTGTKERYVREWLGNQTAGGYVAYDPAEGTFELRPEQAFVLADEKSPVFLNGAFESVASCYTDHEAFVQAFTTGKAVGWGDHDDRLYSGVVRLFRPGYEANLVSSWLPALDDVVEKLRDGASVADVGCGLGASTIIMAQAFEHSSFVGYDIHAPSIEAARVAATEAGVEHRAKFEVASALDFPGTGYDLVTMFDCLHDMGDPVGAARRVRESMAADGTLLLVEPAAGERLEDNLNPVSRLFYGLSTVICTPSSLAQDVGLGLGAQAGPKRLEEVLNEAGFSHVRVATQTPFNLIIEARA
jgi:SAM-dependent methyltransferase